MVLIRQSGKFWWGPKSPPLGTSEPLHTPREDEVNCMIKPSALLPKGKWPCREQSFSFVNIFLASSFYKSLPFRTTPQSSPPLAGWTAAQFMNHLIKQLDLQIHSVEFRFLISHPTINIPFITNMEFTSVMCFVQSHTIPSFIYEWKYSAQ